MSDSDESDWTSSGDEWKPESPVSVTKPKPKSNGKNVPPKQICNTKTATLKPNASTSKLIQPTMPSTSTNVTSDTCGALMELTESNSKESRHSKRNVVRPNYKEPPPDPQDDRYLCE